MGRRLVFAAAVSFPALALAVPLSAATFPRTNGLLVYEAQIGRHAQLFTIKANGNGVHQLTHFGDSDAVWAEWSPSGNQIAFERDVYAGVHVNHAAIYIVNADGSRLRSLTPTGLTTAGMPTAM